MSRQSEKTNTASLIKSHLANRPEAPAITFLDEQCNELVALSYGELNELAMRAAKYLLSHCNPGDRVMLLLPSGHDFVVFFLGCLYAGITAVPVNMPNGTRGSQIAKITSIARNCEASLILVTTSSATKLRQADLDINEEILKDIIVEQLIEEESSAPALEEASPDAIAFLQYTSGSTGFPKGVMVTHNNIQDNTARLAGLFNTRPDSVFCCWAPMFHDMGLVGHLLHSLCAGAHLVLMPPMAFVRSPSNWIYTFDRYRGTIAGAPNFAYEICSAKFTERESHAPDLSCWEIACVGGEPVRRDTLVKFYRRFKAYGFKAEALSPSYGLAESTLIVSGSDASTEPVSVAFDANSLKMNRAEKLWSEPVSQADTGKITSNGSEPRFLVSSGTPVKGVNPKVVGVDGTAVAPYAIGEIWIQSPSIAEGYWRDSESTRIFQAYLSDTQEGPFLRTGDLGFLDENHQLYITSRAKDLIVIRGVNYNPQDIEYTAQQASPALVADSCAAFSIDVDDEEYLFIVHEIKRESIRTENLQDIIENIRISVITNHGIEPRSICLIKPASLSKTTSGKVQRALTKTLYQSGELRIVEEMDTANKQSETDGEQRNMSLEIEQHITSIWSEILDISPNKLTPTSNLFAWGGDSLKVNQMITSLRESYGIDIPLDDLYDEPTIEALVDLIQEQLASPEQGDQLEEGLIY